MQAEARGRAPSTAPSSSSPAAARPAGLVRRAAGPTPRRRARARRRPSAPTSSTGHQRCSDSGEHAGAEQRQQAAARRDSTRPLSVYDTPDPPQEAMRGVLARRRACRRPGNAHCAGAPATASVRVRRVSAGTVAVGIEHDPAVRGLELVLGDEPREQWVVPEAAPEPGRADHLRAAVERRLHAESPLARPRAERLVPLARPPGRTARAASRSRAARSRGASRWKPSSPRREK